MENAFTFGAPLTTSTMKDILKAGNPSSKNVQLLSQSGSISVPHDDLLEVPFTGVQVCLTTPSIVPVPNPMIRSPTMSPLDRSTKFFILGDL